jgi:hypothetical protein
VLVFVLSVDAMEARAVPAKLLVREAVLIYPSEPRETDVLTRELLAAAAGKAVIMALPRLLMAV